MAKYTIDFIREADSWTWEVRLNGSFILAGTNRKDIAEKALDLYLGDPDNSVIRYRDDNTLTARVQRAKDERADTELASADKVLAAGQRSGHWFEQLEKKDNPNA
jgi:hypothetical protein